MPNSPRSIRRLTALCTVVLSLILPAVALASYGAIAVDPATGSSGASFGALTRAAAERTAKRDCHGQCRVLLWVRDECAAAVETRTDYWGGFGRSRSAAIRDARRRAHDSKAELIAWTCSR